MKSRILESMIATSAFCLVYWGNREVKAHWLVNASLLILFLACMAGIFLIKEEDK